MQFNHTLYTLSSLYKTLHLVQGWLCWLEICPLLVGLVNAVNGAF